MARVYRNSTRLLGLLTAAIGIAMIVATLARGGGPAALGVVVGVLFILLGVGRIYLSSGRRTRRARP